LGTRNSVLCTSVASYRIIFTPHVDILSSGNGGRGVSCAGIMGDRGERAAIGNSLIVDKKEGVILFSKPRLAPEDIVALNFAKALEDAGIDYVVVAGYVAILFGRARRSDDVVFILEDPGEEGFIGLCPRAPRGSRGAWAREGTPLAGAKNC